MSNAGVQVLPPSLERSAFSRTFLPALHHTPRSSDAVLAGFGRFSSVFKGFAHLMALAPGLPGDYLRVAYYALTLRKCSLHSRVSFGSFFAHRNGIAGGAGGIGLLPLEQSSF